MLRIIDKERVTYSGNDHTGLKLNQFRMQLQYKEDILKIYITNRDAGAMILNSDKKWTTLKSFNEFGFYNNIASEFLVDVSKYLNSFYNTDEFNTLTD